MGENKYYFIIIDNYFGFVVEGLHEITENDVLITNKDYNTFFENQEKGKCYRLKKEIKLNKGLFGYIEEYTPEVIPIPITEEEQQDLDQLEYLMELDLRLTSLELGLNE